MATTQQVADPIDSRESLESEVIDGELKPVSADNFNELPPSAKDEKLKYNVSHDSSALGLSRDAPSQMASLNAGGDLNALYPASMYSPPAQMYLSGGEWEEYTQHINEGWEVGSAGIYAQDPSLVYQTGYGYSPNMHYGPYCPVAMPLPSTNGAGHLYSPHYYSDSHYQQPSPTSMPYLSSSAPVSQAPLIGQGGSLLSDATNASSVPYGPRAGYVSYGSFGGGSLERNSVALGFYDLKQGFDNFGYDGFWPDWWKSPDGIYLSPPGSSPQSVSQQHRSQYVFGTSVNSYDRWYPHGKTFGGSFPSLDNEKNIAVRKSSKGGKDNVSVDISGGTLNFLSEQNRGPRANRSKNHVTPQNSVTDNVAVNSFGVIDCEQYNSTNFVTEYKDARFFIIKSYTEDNVHKSIKYGVWASTSHGNRKLNSAYTESKEKGHSHPIFLFFSVNASAHFCGVAEMIGPVDFEKSVDFWQQNRWSGQFPVKWHVVKDVPNTLFRHIILENNDNKPVTNSRDTQEVKLDQGQEMLEIFKKYEYEVSILDDFEFYEERENALKERKAQQQLTDSTRAASVASGDRRRNPVVVSADSISQMSKSFTHVVRLERKTNVD